MYPVHHPTATLASAVLVATLMAGCSGGSSRDPFASGLPGAHVVFDRVDCDPSPDTCTRYVILAPAGASTADILAAATARAERELRWRPTAATGVVEPDEGRGFDGPAASGGFINVASRELHYWARVGYARSDRTNTVLDAAQAVMRRLPAAVVLRIDE